jgi:hypothetical protein
VTGYQGKQLQADGCNRCSENTNFSIHLLVTGYQGKQLLCKWDLTWDLNTKDGNIASCVWHWLVLVSFLSTSQVNGLSVYNGDGHWDQKSMATIYNIIFAPCKSFLLWAQAMGY